GDFTNRLPHDDWRAAMNLDVNTLFLVTIYVEAILGLLLLLLEIFAEVASSCLRRIDLFGRLGGKSSPHSCMTPHASALWRWPSRSAVHLRRPRAKSRDTRSTERSASASSSHTMRCSIFRRCWRRPIMRSTAPRTRGETGSRSPRSTIAPSAVRPNFSVRQPNRPPNPQPEFGKSSLPSYALLSER